MIMSLKSLLLQIKSQWVIISTFKKDTKSLVPYITIVSVITLYRSTVYYHSSLNLNAISAYPQSFTNYNPHLLSLIAIMHH